MWRSMLAILVDLLKNVLFYMFHYFSCSIEGATKTPPQRTLLQNPHNRDVSILVFRYCLKNSFFKKQVFKCCLKGLKKQRPFSQGGPKRGNLIMTTRTVTARRNGDPQHYVEGTTSLPPDSFTPAPFKKQNMSKRCFPPPGCSGYLFS